MYKWKFLPLCKAGSPLKNQCNLSCQQTTEGKSYDHIIGA